MPLSFVCGIISAVFVSIGAKQTKKTQEVMDRLENAFAQQKSDLEDDQQAADMEEAGGGSPGSKRLQNDGEDEEVPLQTLSRSSS